MFNLKNRDETVVNWQGAKFRPIDVGATDYVTTDERKAFQINSSASGDIMVLGYLDKDDATKKQLIHVVEGWNPCNLHTVYNDALNTITEMTAIY